MPLTQEQEEINLKLAQLKLCIDNKLILKDHNCNWIFKRLGNINSRVIATENLQLNHRDLIGCTALNFALESKNLEALEILLSHGADFTAKNQAGSTVLHIAVQQLYTCDVEHFKVQFENNFVNAILTAHINCRNFENPSDSNGFSHFHAACIMNYAELVELFLINAIPIDDAVSKDSVYFSGFTPLHFAAKFFALETVEILLKHEADRNVKDARGLTPLHLLLERSIKFLRSEHGQKDTSAKEFIKSRIIQITRLFVDDTFDGDMLFIDELGFSQFHLTCITGNLSSIEHYTNKVVSIDHAVNMDSPLCPGYTGLHFAAQFSIETVKLLIKKGANIGSEDAKGITPFDLCLQIYKVQEIHTILSLHPICKNITFSNRKENRSSIVLRSRPTKLLDLVLAMRGVDEFVEFMQTSMTKANVFVPLNSPLWPGFTPLHVAVSLCKNSDDLVECKLIFSELCKRGGDLNSQDARGRTPINVAFRQGKNKIIEYLMQLCCYNELENVVDEDGLSHLHIFCTVSCFLSLFGIANTWLPDINNVNVAYKGRFPIGQSIIPGSTPLHVAATNPKYWRVIVPKVLKSNADVLAKDSRGMTGFHLMLKCKDEDDDSFWRTAREVQLPWPLRDSIAEDIQLSHLHVACYLNHNADVKMLIELGADVNKAIVRRTNDEIDSYFDQFVAFTPLHFATLQRNRKVMELLIQRGADILAKNSKGLSPLYLSLITSEPHLDLFVEVLKSNVDLQKRMENDVGLTMLHVACRLADVDLAKKLLDKGADVNAQVRPDSSIWPGFGPLHVWASFLKQPDVENGKGPFYEDVLELLLEKNADVTLSDAAGDTPLHIVCDKWKNTSLPGSPFLTIGHCKLLLLQAHRDFRVNPVNVKGISLFHLTCMLGELNVAEKLLKHGKVDVNKPVDSFSNTLPGCAPLDLALSSCYLRLNLFSQVEMVDMLLRHGANVHAENILGDTPLHVSTRYCSVIEDVFDRLVRGGADVNKCNVKGLTPLILLFHRPHVSIEKVRHFLKCGCRLNSRNPLTGHSYWYMAFSTMNFKEFQHLVFDTSINFSHMLEPDEEGCTIIHNIVSNIPSETYNDRYLLMLRKLLKKCDVDDQDKLGRTALHHAAKCFNYCAVSELLMAGADINILDSRGHSAFRDLIGNKLNDSLLHHEEMVQCFLMHMSDLLGYGLHVSPIFSKEFGQTFVIFRDDDVIDIFKSRREQVKHLKIGSYVFEKFLSEVGVVSDYPTMSQMKRDAIDDFFMSIDHDFCEKYSEVVALLRLQYRKALARVELAERANESLIIVTGFRLPDVCSQIILKLLPNEDLKNLIASTLGY